MSEEESAVEFFNEMAAILSLLVVPIAACSAGVSLLRAKQNKNWLELMPLISLELLIVFMWTCLACDEQGYFRYKLSGIYQIKGSPFR